MARFFKKRSEKAGLPPGYLAHMGEERPERVKISVIDYDENHFEERTVDTVEECFQFKAKPTVTWINIDDIHQVDIVEKIGSCFDIHPLVLEDIVTSGQRPKVEDFDTYIYAVLKMLAYKGRQEVDVTQISFILGPNFVISFQERAGDVFEPVRDRIRNARGRIRKMPADYLMYALMDAIIDNYFIILEKLGERVAATEEHVVENPDRAALHEIHAQQKEILYVRRAVWPLRELIGKLLRAESSLISRSTAIYLRDAYDHTVQVIDTVETLRDILSHMLEVYVSNISNKLNEVMKVLTIIATIFIPITWVTGIYGMNFAFMPPKDQAWGFPAVMALMLLAAGAMVIYFRRRKWF